MKVVINKCYGGFGLSPLATKMIAERTGKKCFFFEHDYDKREYAPITLEKATKKGWYFAFDEPKAIYDDNQWYEDHDVSTRYIDRADPNLITVVEELGDKASGACGKLEVVEIPDGIEYEIEEYDGYEHIAERHRTWG